MYGMRTSNLNIIIDRKIDDFGIPGGILKPEINPVFFAFYTAKIL